MILGITGLAGAGKDTAADILVREFNAAKISLADPMKRFCQEVFDFSDEQLWGPSDCRNAKDLRYPKVGPDNSYLTPRYALQTLGTQWGRACYENVWIDYAIRTAQERLADEWPYVVIPDVRFANELAAIKAAGGRVFRIERQGAGLTGEAAQHVSETEQNSFADVVETIRNDGTIEDLATALRWAINSPR